MKNIMTQIIGKVGILVLVLAIGMSSCADKETSIYNPNYNAPNPDPVITSIEPASGYLAGIDKIVINGQNFIADTVTTRVYFDGLPGVTLKATPTQLEVRPSAFAIGNPLVVKAVVIGAENFSNEFNYRIDSPIIRLPGVNDSDEPWAVTLDKDGNVYTHLLRDGTDFGIQKYNPITEEITSFQSPPSSASRVLRWNALKFGPDGFLYGVRSNRAIFKTDGGVKAFVTTKTIASGSLVDLDFDKNGDLWVVGSTPNVFRLDMTNPAVNNTSVANPTELTTIQGIRIVNDTVYLLGVKGTAITGTNVQIWKYTLDNTNSLTNGEMLVSLTDATNISSIEAFSMTVSIDNNLYVGVNSSNGILKVSPTGTISILYPGIVQTRIINMAWDSSRTLYIIAEETSNRDGIVLTNQRIFELNMLEQRTAVYHGIE